MVVVVARFEKRLKTADEQPPHFIQRVRARETEVKARNGEWTLESRLIIQDDACVWSGVLLTDNTHVEKIDRWLNQASRRITRRRRKEPGIPRKVIVRWGARGHREAPGGTGRHPPPVADTQIERERKRKSMHELLGGQCDPKIITCPRSSNNGTRR